MPEQTDGTAARARPHGPVAKGLHWISARLLGYGFLKGLDDVAQLADPALLQFEVKFALVLGGVFAACLAWSRLIAGTTRLPQAAPK